MQTWKKLQVVQAALADILLEISLFWGYFESNILYFWVRMEEKGLTIEYWGLIKKIGGRRMENGGFRVQNWGWRAMDWGQAIKIWGFHHATLILILFILCRKSHYFEDIVKLKIFRLRMIYNFFQVCIADRLRQVKSGQVSYFNCRRKKCLDQKLFRPKCFGPKFYFGHHSFWSQNFFEPKFFGPKDLI